MRRRALGLLTLVCLSGCSSVCLPENQPHRGRPKTAEELFEVVQYLAREDCTDELYERLSSKTRGEFKEITFSLFWEGFPIPEYDYVLGDVVKKGKMLAAVEGPKKGEWFVYVEYQEPGKKNLLAQILVLMERDLGSMVPRVGMQDQIDRIQAGDGKYWWDAATGNCSGPEDLQGAPPK